MSLASRIARSGGEFIAPAPVPLADRVTALEAQLKAALSRIEALETVSKQSQPVSAPRETSLKKSQGAKPWEAAGMSKASWYRRKKEPNNA